MNKITAKNFVESGEHLPPFLRDFHDQKLFFKYLAEILTRNPPIQAEGWIRDQIYTIDYLLWILGKCGWTLQRSRKQVDFFDLGASLKEFEGEQLKAFHAALSARLSAAPAPAAGSEQEFQWC